MAAAGGVLILALAGTYEENREAGAFPVLEEFERELRGDGLRALFRLAYPGAAEESRQEEGGTWSEKILWWLEGRDPRIRFEQSRDDGSLLRGDPDPSFGPYLESRQVVMESVYLISGGSEETGSDRLELAGYPGTGGTGPGASGEGAKQLPGMPGGTPAHSVNPDLPVPGTVYVREQLADYDFLMKHFFSVHSSTTAGRDEMDADRLLGEDLSLEKDRENPQILIYHTHSQETFADYGPDRPDATVVGIGEYLTELLEEMGYRVIHDTTVYDLIDGELDRSRAYDHALKGITAILQQNPSVQVILDIHRDGVREDLHMVSEVNGKPTAPIMFFNGMSQTPEGAIEYLPNPYKEQNLAFSLQMQLDAAAYYPGLTRKIYLKAFRYNLHLRPRSALIEVGAQTNTYEEARNAMEPLSRLLDMVLNPEEEES